jgi:RNA polymerase sigma-70 factor (ECF subfamily)
MTGSSLGAHHDADERGLVDAARGGDERAFGVLLERYRPGLEEFCCLMLGDPQHAEDAMRDAILTAWRERGLAPSSPSVRTWLYRIALRECSEALGAPAMSFRTGARLTG